MDSLTTPERTDWHNQREFWMHPQTGTKADPPLYTANRPLKFSAGGMVSWTRELIRMQSGRRFEIRLRFRQVLLA